MIQNAPISPAGRTASWQNRLRALAARIRHPLGKRGSEEVPATTPLQLEQQPIPATVSSPHDYRLAIAFSRREVGELLLERAASFQHREGLVMSSQRLKLQADGGGCLFLELRCTNAQRGRLVRFVEQCTATAGVSRVRWKGVPGD